jgi:hypothetical protein
MTLIDRLQIVLVCAVLTPAAIGALSLLYETLKRKDF